MKIQNVSGQTLIVSDLPGVQGGSGLELSPGQFAVVFNQDAEMSAQLGAFLTSGLIIQVDLTEPNADQPTAAAAPGSCLFFGPFINMPLSSAIYSGIGGVGATTSVYASDSGAGLGLGCSQFPVPRVCSVGDLFAHVDGVMAAGSIVVLTLMINGAASSVCLTLGPGRSIFSDGGAAHVVLQAGDSVALRAQTNGVAPIASVTCSAVLY